MAAKVSLSQQKLQSALNEDSEFRLAARFWDGSLRFLIGDDAYIVRLRGGEVSSVDAERDAPAGRGDVIISASAEEWSRMLDAVPRPFYHDFYPASRHHDFRLQGDADYLWPYYAAIRRSGEVLRSIATIEKE